MASGERFPCIVCQSLTNSIYELHNHQKICHTSEELSMSVIYLVNYMCLQQNMALRLRNVSNHLVWPGYVADYHNRKDHTQTLENADQIQHFAELRTNVQKPINYIPSQSRYEESKTATSTKVKENQLEHQVASSSGLNKSESQENDRMNTLSGSFVTNFGVEVDEVEEINDETFLQSVNGICRDLNSFGKAADLGIKKRNCRPIRTTGEKCHNKKTNKRKCNDQINFYSSHPISCRKNDQNNAIASCSSKNDKAPLKLASFAQTFQYLKQRKIESPNSMNSVNAQGSKGKTFPLHKGISIFQEALSTTDYEHKLKETMSMSDSNFSTDLSGQPGISGTKSYAKKSDIDGKIEGI